MFKALWQSIVGRGREAVNNSVDLKYAGKEQIRSLRQDIDNLESRNIEIQGRRMLVEERRLQAQNEATRYLNAVKEWKAAGDEDKAKRSYNEYTKYTQEQERLAKQVGVYDEQIAGIDANIAELTESVDQLTDSLEMASADQQYGRGLKQAESIHKSIDRGSLSEVIEQSKQQTAQAKAARDRRVGADVSDLTPPKPNANVLKYEDL